MSDFDLSMVITGDASSASAAAKDASSSLDAVSDAQSRVAKTAEDMAASTGAAASGLGKIEDAATETAGATKTLDAAFVQLQTELAAARAQAEQAAAGIITLEKANADLVAELSTSQRSIAGLASQVDVLETRLASASRTHGEAGKSLGTVGIAAAETEHAVRAFADSVNAGQDPVRAFTLELPRLTQAAGFMGGALGAVGEFLAGPWGIALTIGVSVLAPLIEHLLDTPDAAEQAKKALEDVAEANKTLASVIDQTNGKISEQNQLLARAALLSAPQKIAENNKATLGSIKEGFEAANKTIDDFALTGTRAAKAMFGLTTITRDQVRGADDLSDAVKNAKGNLGTLTVAVNKLADTNPALRPLRDQLNGYFESAVKSNDATKALIGNQKEATAALTSQGALTQTVVENQIALATATDSVSKAQAKLNILRQQEQSLFKQPYSDQRNAQILQVRDQIIAEQKALDAAQEAQRSSKKKPAKIADPTGTINALSNEALADINSYTEAPTYLAKANEELKKLQDGLDKLSTIKPRSPLDAEKISAAKDLLNEAADTIRDHLDKPFQDFLRTQDQAYQKAKLMASGQVDQANALTTIIALQKQQGPLDDDHLEAIVESVTKLREQADAYALIKQRQDVLMQGLSAYKNDLESIFDGSGKLKDLPKKLVVDFQSLSGKLLFQDLFGKAFQDIEKQITGEDGVSGVTKELKAAIAKVTPATDDFKGDLDTAGKAVTSFADTVNQAAAAISGKGASGAANNLLGSALSLPASTGSSSVFDKLGDAITKNLNSTLFSSSGGGGTSGVNANGEIVVNANRPTSATNLSALGLTQNAITKLAKGVGISDDAAKTIGKFSGTAIKGAAEGALTNSVFAPIAKGLGIKTSSTGAQIGGAIGSFLPIPGGSIIGSIAGSILGGLFKKTKTGGATITDSTSAATLSGNTASYEAAANSLAGSVQQGIASIAQQLGGTAGSFGGITIGQYKDKYRVNTVSTKLGGSSSPVPGLTSYDSADEAVAAAIQAAVAKGAVSGLSAAVQRALTSNSDINTGISEALKVKNLETVLANVGNQFNSIFQSFDAAASDAVATAKKYGVDLAATEKYYADQRSKLVADTLKQATGSLQDFLDSVQYGDLADGDAATKRTALLSKIASTKALADTGDQDSINALADLYNQLISTTKDAFGTAGSEYATDKGTAVSGAQSVIQQETDRINQAAGLTQATTDAVNKNNTLTNETNDLIAQTNALLSSMVVSSGGVTTGIVSANLPSVSRSLTIAQR